MLCALFIEVARADGDVVRVVREYFANTLKYGPEALDVVRRYLKEHLARPASLEDSIAACRDELPTAEHLLLLDALYSLALVDGQLARHFGDGDVHDTRLGLSPDASDADVKRAFRQLAATHHPDRVAHLGQGAVEQASRRFQEIREAHDEIRRLRGL